MEDRTSSWSEITLQSSLRARELEELGDKTSAFLGVDSSVISSSAKSSVVRCLTRERAYSKSRYIDSIAVATPSSCCRRQQMLYKKGRKIDTARICSPRSFALLICFTSVVATLSASVSAVTVNFLTPAPTPKASTRSAQKN